MSDATVASGPQMSQSATFCLSFVNGTLDLRLARDVEHVLEGSRMLCMSSRRVAVMDGTFCVEFVTSTPVPPYSDGVPSWRGNPAGTYVAYYRDALRGLSFRAEAAGRELVSTGQLDHVSRSVKASDRRVADPCRRARAREEGCSGRR